MEMIGTYATDFFVITEHDNGVLTKLDRGDPSVITKTHLWEINGNINYV